MMSLSHGKWIDLLDPSPSAISLPVIANTLSKLCRRGGHCPEFYSVAEHCVLATHLAMADCQPREICAGVLLHDAAEAYIGDLVTPLKDLLPEYAQIERRVLDAVAVALRVSFQHDAIWVYDRRMLDIEQSAFDNAGTSELKPCLQYWRPLEAESQFLALAETLLDEAIPRV